MDKLPKPLTIFKIVKKIDIGKILRHPDDSDSGSLPEVDLHYADSYHDQFNDLPLPATK